MKNANGNIAKKLRIRFVILMIISAFGAMFAYHSHVSDSPLSTLWSFILAINTLTFLISGYGLFTNLLASLTRESHEQIPTTDEQRNIDESK